MSFGIFNKHSALKFLKGNLNEAKKTKEYNWEPNVRLCAATGKHVSHAHAVVFTYTILVFYVNILFSKRLKNRSNVYFLNKVL